LESKGTREGWLGKIFRGGQGPQGVAVPIIIIIVIIIIIIIVIIIIIISVRKPSFMCT
jgi:hypothetical protein